MAHDKVFGICENKCLVPVAPKTDVDAMKEKVDAIELNNDGGITVDSAINLNKVVNVTPSNTLTTHKRYLSVLMCPYVPGIKYTGSVKHQTDNTSVADNRGAFYILSSTGQWSSSSKSTVEFTNALCVLYIHGNTNTEDGVYLPIYS